MTFASKCCQGDEVGLQVWECFPGCNMMGVYCSVTLVLGICCTVTLALWVILCWWNMPTHCLYQPLSLLLWQNSRHQLHGGEIYFSSWSRGISVYPGRQGMMVEAAICAGRIVRQLVTLHQAKSLIHPTAWSISTAHFLLKGNMKTYSTGTNGRLVLSSHIYCLTR